MSEANDKTTRLVDAEASVKRALKPYSPPRLQIYGTVAKLTQNQAGSGADGGMAAGKTFGAAMCL